MVTVGNGTSLIGWAEVFSVVTTLEKKICMCFFFNYSYCNLLFSPLVPAIDSKVTGKSNKTEDDKEPKNPVDKSMTSVKDIRDPMDACTTGKVFGGLDKGSAVCLSAYHFFERIEG